MSQLLSSIRVSVVVPTRGRPVLLARCLQALLAQDYPADSYEILVCDDGASARTRAQVQALDVPGGKGPRIRYLAALATRGPAAAPNLGWHAAQGPVIAFTDDDTIPAPDWLSQGMLALRPGVHAVSGATDMPLPSPPTDYERDASGLTRAEFITANCLVRRAVLEEVGGFDPAGLRIQKKVMFDVLLYRKYPRLYRARVRHGPPWFYLSVALSLAGAVAAALAGYWPAAAGLLGIWLVLTGYFFARRLDGLSRKPGHVAELALTSAAIPVLSIAWRLVGMARYGARFP